MIQIDDHFKGIWREFMFLQGIDWVFGINLYPSVSHINILMYFLTCLDPQQCGHQVSGVWPLVQQLLPLHRTHGQEWLEHHDKGMLPARHQNVNTYREGLQKGFQGVLFYIQHQYHVCRSLPEIFFLLYCVCMKLIVGDYFEPPTDKLWMCDIWGCNCGFAEDSTCVECSALSVGKYMFINKNVITFRNTGSIKHWIDVLAYRVAIFRHFAKLWKVTVSFILFVYPSILLSLSSHGTTWLTTDGFLWSLICEYLLQISQENSRFIKIWQE